MLVGRGMGGWVSSITSSIEHIATAPAGVLNNLISTGGAVGNSLGSQGLTMVGGVANHALGAVGGLGSSLHPGGSATAPGAAPPPTSNTPLIVAGVGVALILGIVLLRRRPAPAPAVAA